MPPQIISNTTVSRPDPVSNHPLAGESGGLSGKPLFDMSTNILKEMYILTRVLPLILIFFNWQHLLWPSICKPFFVVFYL